MNQTETTEDTKCTSKLLKGVSVETSPQARQYKLGGSHSGNRTSVGIKEFKEDFFTLIAGQEKEKEKIFEVLKRVSDIIPKKKGAMGRIAIVGNPAVGKSETPEVVAQLLLGDRDGYTRIHGPDFYDDHTKASLIGSPHGYTGYGDESLLSYTSLYKPFNEAQEQGTLSPLIADKENFAIVVVDEADKMHNSLMDMFLDPLDKGVIQLASGEKVEMKNVLFFFLANYHTDSKTVGFASEQASEKKAFSSIFPKPLQSRLDESVIYHDLKKEDFYHIFKLQIDIWKERVLTATEGHLILSTNNPNELFEYNYTKMEEKVATGKRKDPRLLIDIIGETIGEEINHVLKSSPRLRTKKKKDWKDGQLIIDIKENALISSYIPGKVYLPDNIKEQLVPQKQNNGATDFVVYTIVKGNNGQNIPSLYKTFERQMIPFTAYKDAYANRFSLSETKVNEIRNNFWAQGFTEIDTSLAEHQVLLEELVNKENEVKQMNRSYFIDQGFPAPEAMYARLTTYAPDDPENYIAYLASILEEFFCEVFETRNLDKEQTLYMFYIILQVYPDITSRILVDAMHV
ncbi:MAG: AAA family ATPase [Patescibacteria group bacterium]|nr:AAA family ATPase [Patescibacteria group bacterium]